MQAPPGACLLDVLRAAGVFVDAPCGGQGQCGKCGVLIDGVWRPACRTRVDSDIHVLVPSLSSPDGSETPRTGAVAPGHPLGVAVDLGTTTISLVLLDTQTGSAVDTMTFYNPQIAYGADVIGRIVYSLKGNGRQVLQHAVSTAIERAILHLCSANRTRTQDIREVVVAGNTTMQHLLLGLDARYIREEPYEPVTKLFPARPAAAVFPALQEAVLHLLPCVANYLGADLVAGTAVCGMRHADTLSVLLDIGTNGEIVAGTRDWMVGCACSAGPAFEGMGLSCGMRHREGAITDASAEHGELRYTVAGGVAPEGISGTGAVGLIVALKELGVIDGRGRFTQDGQRGITLHPAKPVCLDVTDIDNVIRAKAAVFAGLSLLLRRVSLGLSDIHRFYLAGGMGSALVLKSAVSLGLLPPVLSNRTICMGNTSLKGAAKYLLDQEFRVEVGEVQRMTTYFDLSYEPGYMDEYVAALFIPHTDGKLFERDARAEVSP